MLNKIPRCLKSGNRPLSTYLALAKTKKINIGLDPPKVSQNKNDCKKGNIDFLELLFSYACILTGYLSTSKLFNMQFAGLEMLIGFFLLLEIEQGLTSMLVCNIRSWRDCFNFIAG